MRAPGYSRAMTTPLIYVLPRDILLHVQVLQRPPRVARACRSTNSRVFYGRVSRNGITNVLILHAHIRALS